MSCVEQMLNYISLKKERQKNEMNADQSYSSSLDDTSSTIQTNLFSPEEFHHKKNQEEIL